jgi:hypothetical protein
MFITTKAEPEQVAKKDQLACTPKLAQILDNILNQLHCLLPVKTGIRVVADETTEDTSEVFNITVTGVVNKKVLAAIFKSSSINYAKPVAMYRDIAEPPEIFILKITDSEMINRCLQKRIRTLVTQMEAHLHQLILLKKLQGQITDYSIYYDLKQYLICLKAKATQVITHKYLTSVLALCTEKPSRDNLSKDDLHQERELSCLGFSTINNPFAKEIAQHGTDKNIEDFVVTINNPAACYKVLHDTFKSANSAHLTQIKKAGKGAASPRPEARPQSLLYLIGAESIKGSISAGVMDHSAPNQLTHQASCPAALSYSDGSGSDSGSSYSVPSDEENQSPSTSWSPTPPSPEKRDSGAYSSRSSNDSDISLPPPFFPPTAPKNTPITPKQQSDNKGKTKCCRIL